MKNHFRGTNQAIASAIRRLSILGAFAMTTCLLSAATYTWAPTSNAGNKGWNVGASWQGGVAPSTSSELNDFIFGGNFKLNANMEASYTVGGISFASGAGSFAMVNTVGTTLTLGSLGFANNSSVNQTINITDLSLSANQTWNAISSDLTFGGTTVSLGANTLIFDGANAISVGNAINGTGGLTKNGGGTTTLNGANTYSGNTVINSGTLNISGANALGGTTEIHLNGGFLALNGADPLDRVSDAATLIMNGGTLLGNGFSESFGNLDLRLDSYINLGASGQLTFAGGTYSSGTLYINGWTGTAGGPGSGQTIIFSADPGATFLNNIVFTGFDPGAMWLAGGEIVPVPEVNTAVLLGLGFAGVGAWRWNSRRKQS
jgi:autotransporter-associated beta strand protein